MGGGTVMGGLQDEILVLESCINLNLLLTIILISCSHPSQSVAYIHSNLLLTSIPILPSNPSPSLAHMHPNPLLTFIPISCSHSSQFLPHPNFLFTSMLIFPTLLILLPDSTGVRETTSELQEMAGEPSKCMSSHLNVPISFLCALNPGCPK